MIFVLANFLSTFVVIHGMLPVGIVGLLIATLAGPVAVVMFMKAKRYATGAGVALALIPPFVVGYLREYFGLPSGLPSNLGYATAALVIIGCIVFLPNKPQS